MSQTSQLIRTLKACLKQQHKTYADLAVALSLSEASVKRMFSKKTFTLERLEQICTWLDMDIAELALMCRDSRPLISQLTPEQEEELVANPKLLLVAYMVTQGWQYQDLLEHYQLEPLETIRLLAHLDRLGMIHLLPGNRVKLLTARNFSWRQGGPMERYFNQNVKREFFSSDFRSPQELMHFLPGMISAEQWPELKRQLDNLAKTFDDMVHSPSSQPLTERNGCSLVIAYRQWEFSGFSKLKR
jgi:transcriptional regulator with XRE-family HTH domain